MADNRPVRLQFRRVKNFDLQAHSLVTNGLPAVLCTRGPGRKFGNPFVIEKVTETRWCIGVLDRPGVWFRDTQQEATELAVKAFAAWIKQPAQAKLRDLVSQLRGHNLACACKLPHPGEIDMCHARILLEIANSPTCEAVP